LGCGIFIVSRQRRWEKSPPENRMSSQDARVALAVLSLGK